MANDDKTVELVTNLDRAAVEKILQRVAVEAKAQGLDDLITLLGGFVGMSQVELRKRVALCLESLSSSPEHRVLFSQLELVELNLPQLEVDGTHRLAGRHRAPIGIRILLIRVEVLIPFSYRVAGMPIRAGPLYLL